MKKELLKVSIIIPVYGVEKYIKRCAISLFEQTYSNIEYVFVNDATKDNSINILLNVLSQYKEREPQTKIICHDKNKGLSGARNTGIYHMTGDFVLHVDSDDFLEVNAVELLVQQAIKENADIVICDYYSVVAENKEYKSINFSSKEELILGVLHKSISASIWGKLFSAKLYQTNYDVMSIDGIGQGEDYATTPRLYYYANHISKINIALYNYERSNQNSYSLNKSTKSIYSMLKADRKLVDFFSTKQIKEMDMATILGITLLRTKLYLLKRSNSCHFPLINTLYKDEQKQFSKVLSFRDRILLLLLKMKMYKIAKLYIRFGLFLKKC